MYEKDFKDFKVFQMGNTDIFSRRWYENCAYIIKLKIIRNIWHNVLILVNSSYSAIRFELNQFKILNSSEIPENAAEMNHIEVENFLITIHLCQVSF